MPESVATHSRQYDATVLTAVLALGFLAVAASLRQLLGSLWHPAAAFPAVWGVVLLLIYAAQPLNYYNVSPDALMLYSAGCVAFIIGGLVGHRLGSLGVNGKSIALAERINFSRIAWLSILLHLVMVPIWWRTINSIAGDAGNLLLLAAELRYKSVEGLETVGPIVGNYLVLGFIVAPVLLYGAKSDRLKAFPLALATVPWVVTNLLTNGRAALVQMIIAAGYLWFRGGGRLSWRIMVYGLLFFGLIFSGGAILLGKNSAALPTDGSLWPLVRAIVENLFDYLLQGPILFSIYLHSPTLINPTWNAFSFGCEILSKFNACIPTSLHQDFLNFGSHGRDGNVYSIYLSIYPAYGVVGVVAIMVVYGLWASYHDRRATDETSGLAQPIVASYLFSAIPLSVFSDLFAPSLNFLLKVAITCVILEWLFAKRQVRRGTDARRVGPQH